MNLYIPNTDILVPTGGVVLTLKDAKTGRIKSVDVVENTVVTTGKVSMAQALRGLTADNRGIITYCAVGTGGTASDETDTLLETELFRKEVSVRSDSGQNAVFQTFYSTGEANGSLLEAGLFGDDATVSADTGTLFARVTISRTKSSSDTLTLRWTVTIG